MSTYDGCIADDQIAIFVEAEPQGPAGAHISHLGKAGVAAIGIWLGYDVIAKFVQHVQFP